MRETATRIGDAMLRRLLPQAVAGACIPENGQPCKCGACKQPEGPCFLYRLNCTGQCLKTSSTC